MDPRSGDLAAAALEIRNVSKAFGDVLANDRVDLTLYKGEVHCLVGENGAGKSTLMNIVAGIHTPDEGSLRVDGREVRVTCPHDAIGLGIGMVHQHSSLVPTFTVLENLMLGRGGGLRLGAKEAAEGLRKLSAALGVDVDPAVEVDQLALGQRQQVEIVKALWRGSRVLILDEPTSMLTPQGVADLEKALAQLKQRGLAVVFITHKLHEALDVADRISVMRQGRIAGTLGPEVLTSSSRDELTEKIVTLMFPGEAESLAGIGELRGDLPTEMVERRPVGEELLRLGGVTVAGRRGEIGIREELSLTVHAGEVVGIAGVDGNGQRPLAEAIAGQRPLSSGDIRLLGRSVKKMGIGARQKRGLRYVTDDRLGEGTVGDLSVSLNLVLKRIGSPPFWTHGRIHPERIAGSARELITEYAIATPGAAARAATLSGGNAQKLVLARELSFDPKVVVFNKPTYGLDVKTTRAVRARIRKLAEDGAGALVISTDLEELLELCDRVAVLSRGALMGVVENEAGAEREIGALMIGGLGRG